MNFLNKLSCFCLLFSFFCFADEIIHPKKLPTVLVNGQIIPSTVESYDVEETGLTSCSLIARNNLSYLLTAMGITVPVLPRGDSDELISKGKKSGDLTSLKKSAILPKLTERYDSHGESVFDVYRFVAHRPKNLQTHRVVVFLGNDTKWYILDPLDGEKSKKPQLLNTYLKNDVKAEWFLRLPGYSILNPISQEELDKSLPYLSDELQLYYHINYFDGRAVFQG